MTSRQITDAGRRATGRWRVLAPEIRRHAVITSDRALAGWQDYHHWQTRQWDRWLPWPVAAVQPWRLLVGGLSVLLPAIVMAFLNPSLPVTTPGVVLLVAVAFSTYLADWVGGVTALGLSSLLLNLFFLGDRTHFSLPKDNVEGAGFIVTMASGAGLIWIIERIKREGADDRLGAVAARAAAHALASIEQVAASAGRGDARDRRRLSHAIVNAMVRVNRAHAGALFVMAPDGSCLLQAAAYGLDEGEDAAPRRLSLADGLTGQIAAERRTCAAEDIQSDWRLVDSPLRQTKLRAVMGAPLISSDDRLLGVALIGLLVRHRFTPTEVARVEALAARAALLLQAAEVADEREMLLDRAREAERRLELVMAAMPEAVIIAAPPDGRVVGYNAAAVALLGPLGDEGINIDISPRLRWPDGDHAESLDLPHLAALRTGEVVAGLEMVVDREDGRSTPVLASAAPIREPDGTLAAVVTVFRDIAALKEAARVKDEFVSIVSHELRSPLTPIRGYVQLVAKDLDRQGGHQTHVQWLTSIETHVDRMTRLVDDLLDVSRLKAGSLDIRAAPMDLVEICHSVVQARTAGAAERRLVVKSGQSSIIGRWDADRLHQVIDNLVGNAIKYSPDGGMVTLAVDIDTIRGEAVLTVSDQGPGISHGDREDVFTAFFRTRDAAESQTAGLGLGLYICRELVVAHGGVIEVSEAPGGGALFLVRLPLDVAFIAA